MNVAVVEPTSTQGAASEVHDGRSSTTSHEAEWIDPEGDDWFASIYRELTEEPSAAVIDKCATEFEHWFG